MPEVTEEQLYYAGTETNPDIALQLAFGNCDPFTLKVLHNFNPDKIKVNSVAIDIDTSEYKFCKWGVNGTGDCKLLLDNERYLNGHFLEPRKSM